jgi:sulfite exporter TauE/SafE
MCGGIQAALALQIPNQNSRFWLVLCFNLGRLSTYVLAGALAGGLGALLLRIPSLTLVQLSLFVIAQIMLVLMGLYLMGFGWVRQILESLGSHLWKVVQPYTLKLFPVNTLNRALALGMAWGLIPCGLIYSMLITAASSATALGGGLVMVSFGLGTLPALFLAGTGLSTLQRTFQSMVFRRFTALLVLGFGVWGLIRLFTGRVVILPGQICVSNFW